MAFWMEFNGSCTNIFYNSQELTDIDMLHEEDVKLLVDELLDGRIVETLVQQALIKLDEKKQDESNTVHNILLIFENVRVLNLKLTK
jgi:ABC-type metal ion transport system substrate-binding protein